MAVTIRDVAREAGVAISTVSKVQNGSTRISPETAERVRAVMKRLDYHPNSIARAFVQQSSGTIGVLMEMSRNSAFMNPYLFEILGGVESVLHAHGFLAAVSNVINPKDILEVLEKMIRAKRVDAYILHASQMSRPIMHYLDQHQVPHVVVGKVEGLRASWWVDTDNEAAGSLAVSHLLAGGYRRPGFIGGMAGDGISESRQAGFRQALKEAGLEVPPERVASIKVSREESFAAVTAMLSLPEHDRPDSLVCVSNFAAAGAIEAIKAKALSIPKDIGVIGFDNFPLAPYLDPPLSVVDLDLYSLGAQAAEALLLRLRNPDIGVSFKLLAPRLIQRQSTLNPG